MEQNINETKVKFTPRGNTVLIRATVEKPSGIILTGKSESDNLKVKELTVVKMGQSVQELEIGDVITLSQDGKIKPLNLPENTETHVYGLVDAYMIEGINKY
jgi:hypothetical protein